MHKKEVLLTTHCTTLNIFAKNGKKAHEQRKSTNSQMVDATLGMAIVNYLEAALWSTWPLLTTFHENPKGIERFTW